MIVAVIPARGGSKRIPRKNVKPFRGKPMIGYPIEAARLSGVFDRIVVSTDDDEIARVARDFGAETPFVRPPRLADDHTPTAPVLSHALAELEARGPRVRSLCCLYATAAFVRPEYLRQGLQTLRASGAASVFSVTSFPFPIFRALRMAPDGSLAMFWPEHELTRSQDLPQAYHDAGQFYWLDRDAFVREPRLFTPDARPVVLPRHLVQDIDTPEDWDTAEKMFAALAADTAAH